MIPDRRLQVAICGDGSPATTHREAARAAGRLLAEAGAVVLTGGMGGVMEAATAAAREAGGLTVAILPGPDPTGLAAAEVRVATGMGEARNVVLVRSASAVVAIGGGPGTLSEIALARKLGVPVFGYQTWQATAPGDGEELVLGCATVEEAVSRALAAAGRP